MPTQFFSPRLFNQPPDSFCTKKRKISPCNPSTANRGKRDKSGGCHRSLTSAINWKRKEDWDYHPISCSRHRVCIGERFGHLSGSVQPVMGSPPGYRILKNLKIQNTSIREFLAEFFGTFILIIYGDAAFATTILEGKGVPDVFGVTWAWGVGVILGITASGGISGGHINPGVTVGFAAVGKLPWRKVPHYLLGQHLGGFFASAVLYFTYYDAFHIYDPELTVVGQNRSAWVFATYPRDDISIWNCFFGEIVAGGLLMFTVMAIVDRKNLNIPKYLYPVFIGFMIQVTAQTFGMNCMAPINPARDFPTRVFTAIAGWGAETFSIRNYGYWWIGLLGPHLGCIIGAWFYLLAIELHWPEDEEFEDAREMTVTAESKGRVR